MINRQIGWFGVLLFAIVPAGAMAKRKPRAPCKAYVIVSEHDGRTVGLQMYGLSKPQKNWYRKHGDKGKVAGICVLHPKSQITATEFFALIKKKRQEGTLDPNVPVYAIFWGEREVRQRYSGSYETKEQTTGNINGTVTDDEGDSADVSGTTESTVPVEHNYSGVKRYFVAWGRLELWTPTARGGKGDFVPLAPLHNHNHTIFTSAATSLLKDGLANIAKRERAAR